MQADQTKRLCIFFFYDAQGVVDRYVTHYLDDLLRHVDTLTIVCNGLLTPEGRDTLLSRTPRLIVRENEGLDVGAYKEGLESVGFDALSGYDEVILANNTLMGPVDSFADMFAEMTPRGLDFWGITAFEQMDSDPTGCNPYGYIPRHIQSHFMVFGKGLLKSPAFAAYWQGLAPIETYQESIGKHESFLTKHLEDQGFAWDVYVRTGDLRGYTENPIIMCPRMLIEERRCPVFKRRSFFHQYNMTLDYSDGRQTGDLFAYLRDHTGYDTDMILENALRTMHQQDFAQQLGLKRILDGAEGSLHSGHGVALYFLVCGPFGLKRAARYIDAMPERADIYLLDASGQDTRALARALEGLGRQPTILPADPSLPPQAALLLAAQGSMRSYPFACLAHNALDTRREPYTMGEGLLLGQWESVLESRAYVQAVLSLFDENPRLGMVVPPMPLHGRYFEFLMDRGFGGRNNLQYDVEQWLGRLSLTVPTAFDKKPLAPYGGAFWCRTDALRAVLSHAFTPRDVGGDYAAPAHMLDFLYPLACQAEGYYPLVCMTRETAARRDTMQGHFLQAFAQTANNRPLYSNSFYTVNYELGLLMKTVNPKEPLGSTGIKRLAKRVLPDRVIRAIKGRK